MIVRRRLLKCRDTLTSPTGVGRYRFRLGLQQSGRLLPLFRARIRIAADDVAHGGSDRLVDAIVAWGDVDAVRDRVAAHLAAGADHVCVQAIGAHPLDELRQVAPALRDL